MFLEEKLKKSILPPCSYSGILNNSKGNKNNISDIIIVPKQGQSLNEIVLETIKILTNNTNKCINKIITGKNKLIVECKNENDVQEVEKIIKLNAATKVDAEIEKLKKNQG